MKDEEDLVQSLLAHDEELEVPAEHERRIRQGLGALLGAVPVAPAPAPPSPAAPSPPAPPPAGVPGAGSALRTWLTTGALAAVAAGGGFVVGRATAPPVVSPSVVTTSTSTSASAPSPSLITSAEPIATAATASGPASAAPSGAPSAPAIAAPPASVAAADAFDREQSLLERARSALVRHDANAAEKTLDEHDRQFPRSRHAEERDYLRIQVLRERGDDARVRERAKAFLAKYPESMLRARVEPLAQ